MHAEVGRARRPSAAKIMKREIDTAREVQSSLRLAPSVERAIVAPASRKQQVADPRQGLQNLRDHLSVDEHVLAVVLHELRWKRDQPLLLIDVAPPQNAAPSQARARETRVCRTCVIHVPA